MFRYSGTPLDYYFVSFSPQQTLVELESLSSGRWKSGKRFVLSKRSVFSTVLSRSGRLQRLILEIFAAG